MGDQAVPADYKQFFEKKVNIMLKLQRRLGSAYEAATDAELVERIASAKDSLADRLVVLGHHYQRDEVIQFADKTGDSLALSRYAAQQHNAEYVVFCGVEFMAEAADILTASHQKVILPDLGAGCSMADMADIDAVELAWKEISQLTDIDNVIPVTYINSSATLKNFVGRHNGAVCTSSNAAAIIKWALSGTKDQDSLPDIVEVAKKTKKKVLFFPDQHLARNTAYRLGFNIEDEVVYDPEIELGGLDQESAERSTFILWKGHCSVHQRFNVAQIENFRNRYDNAVIMAHPECSHEVVEKADIVGSTDAIIRAVNAAKPGTHIGIATEVHLVNRLADTHQDLYIECLDPVMCPCATMNRIDLPHLAWVMDGLLEDTVYNQIIVDEIIKEGAKLALDRMLSIA